MWDYGQDKWSDFNRDIANRELYVFGAGARGGRIAELVNYGVYDWSISAYLDNSKAGGTLHGYRILHPDILKEKEPDTYVVLISINYPGWVSEQLFELGCKYAYSYFYLTEGGRECRKQIIDPAKIDNLQGMLSDKKSIMTLDRIVEKRRNGTIDYSDISESGSEYFIDDFFNSSGDDIYLDGGAYDGDTIEEFLVWTGGRYSSIFAFEVDSNMASHIRKKYERLHDINVIEKGLWDKREPVRFVADNTIYSSHVANDISDIADKTTLIDCTSVEEEIGYDIPFTFIKLDIEGAEIPALKGMRKVIKKYHPNLAISIYHKPDDIWEIPELINSMVPEYKLWIRHFGQNYFGTNLYAAVENR